MGASVRNPQLPAAGARLVSGITSPIEKAYTSTSGSISGFWKNYIWLKDVKEHQVILKDQVKTLQFDNSVLRELRHENRRLRSMLGFKEKAQIPGIPANVIGRDPSNWLKTITIDRGLDSGIEEGSPLVDGHAIVGMATSVGSSSSKVQLLSDSNSAIDALIQNSRAPGVVQGNGGDTLLMRYVEKGEEVRIGDRVVASGYDAIFPKGALIGVVTQVKDEERSLFKIIEVKPGVSINNLETVLVLKKGLSTEQLKSGSDAEVQSEDELVEQNKEASSLLKAKPQKPAPKIKKKIVTKKKIETPPEGASE